MLCSLRILCQRAQRVVICSPRWERESPAWCATCCTSTSLMVLPGHTEEKDMRQCVVLCACAGFATSAFAGPIAYTSFEEPGIFAGQYIDTGDPLAAHALLNNANQPLVNFASIGNELGFSAFYTPSSQSSATTGLSEGDFVGVTDFATTVGAYTNGLNGYEISDSDGLMTVSLDTVTFAGPNWGVSIDAFIQETGWEVADVARIWVEVDGGLELDMLNTAGFDIDDLGIEGSWMSLSLDLSGYTSATLRFELDSNAASEAMFIDNAIFAVPTPGTLALAGFGLVALGRRRR